MRSFSASRSSLTRWRAHTILAITLTICMFALSGCFLQSIVGHVREDGTTSLSANVEVSHCDFDSVIPAFQGCTYTIFDGDFLVDITSTFQLISEFGLFGLLIDPLVLQVPTDVSGVTATYNYQGSDESLVVTETSSFSATPTIEVSAETGTKFLIFELPDSVTSAFPAGSTGFNFSVDFTTTDPANLFVKSMFTGRVDEGGQTYYVPIFPCVTDFAEIPATQVPVSDTFQFLNPTFSPIYSNGDTLACDYVEYDFASVAPVLCAGLPVTIDMNTNGGIGTGTAGADVILGTLSADTIDAGAGDDTVCAGGGDDQVMAGDGDDTVIGGSGNDRLFGEAGRDVMRGNEDADLLDGGPGKDRLLGGTGDDELIGRDGNDYLGGFGGNDLISGGPGDDTIFGGFGGDSIAGDGGNDVIRGLIGDDSIDGGPGNDVLDGDRGNDTIRGGTGDDVIRGGNARDMLFGDDGDDSVSGGRADDVLSGGLGTDVCAGNLHAIADTTDGTCDTVFGVP